MEKTSITFLRMEYCIGDKLRSVGATSIDKAVAIEEVDLDMQELNWINYVAGGLFATVKKTRNKRYYVSP
jgi:hypothetical protein